MAGAMSLLERAFNSRGGRFVAATAGLPEPPVLRRGRTLPSGSVVLANLGPSTLVAEVLELLGLTALEPVLDTGSDPVPAYPGRIGALVVDATSLRTIASLEALRAVLRPAVRALEPSGRVVLVATGAASVEGYEAHAVAQALDGINRTVGKELRAGATSNLVYVDPGVTAAGLASTLSFLLEGRSAYVDGQSWRVSGAGQRTTTESEQASTPRTADSDEASSPTMAEPDEASSPTTAEPDEASSASPSSSSGTVPDEASSQTTAEPDEASSPTTAVPDEASSQTTAEPDEATSASPSSSSGNDPSSSSGTVPDEASSPTTAEPVEASSASPSSSSGTVPDEASSAGPSSSSGTVPDEASSQTTAEPDEATSASPSSSSGTVPDEASSQTTAEPDEASSPTTAVPDEASTPTTAEPDEATSASPSSSSGTVPDEASTAGPSSSSGNVPSSSSGNSSSGSGNVRWSLQGRIVVVTGAARGIGAAIARVLSREGARVVVVDVPASGEALSSVANELHGSAVQLDITAVDAGERIAAHVAQLHGPRSRIHAIVHNAGITRDKLLVNTDAARWASVLRVNLAAQLRINAALLDPGRPGGLADGGRIVGVASTSGIAGNRGQANYAASKAGVVGLVRAMAPDLAARRITVNAVAPGFIETEMTARIPFVQREIFRRTNSLGQAGQPIDVAETIAYFVDPASEGVTGQVVRVCGQNLVGA